MTKNRIEDANDQYSSALVLPELYRPRNITAAKSSPTVPTDDVTDFDVNVEKLVIKWYLKNEILFII